MCHPELTPAKVREYAQRLRDKEKIVDLAAHRSGRLRVVRKVPLEPLVCSDREARTSLNARKECRIVEHPLRKYRHPNPFALTEPARVVEQLCAERGIVLSGHDILYEGNMLHMSRGNIRHGGFFRRAHNWVMADDDLIRRLEEAIAEDGRTPRAVSVAAGLKPGFLQNVIEGKSKDPGVAKIASAAKELKVRLQWLATGEGDKHLGAGEQLNQLDKENRRLADRFIAWLRDNPAQDEETAAQ